MPYALSIKPAGEAPAFREGYHLGDDLAFAKAEAEARYHARQRFNMPTESVAVMDGSEIVDVYFGEWRSEMEW